MNINFTRLLPVLILGVTAAASVVYTATAQEQKATLSGAYCNNTEDPVTKTSYSNQFAALPSGENLLFGLTRFSETTSHSCNLNDGIAVPSGENQWTYEYKQEGAPCKFTISKTSDGGVAIKEAEDSICGMGICGQHAAIGEFSFSADDYQGETSEEAILYIAERDVCAP